jgi:hypothetical protein
LRPVKVELTKLKHRNTELIDAWSDPLRVRSDGTLFGPERKIYARLLEIASGRILEIGVRDGMMIRILARDGVDAEFFSY